MAEQKRQIIGADGKWKDAVDVGGSRKTIEKDGKLVFEDTGMTAAEEKAEAEKKAEEERKAKEAAGEPVDPGPDASLPAKMAYMKAKKEWEKKKAAGSGAAPKSPYP